jgi:myo-inositol-1(or 4)-monophosphatase
MCEITVMSDLEMRLAVVKSIAEDAGQLAKHRYLNRKPGDYTLKGHQDFLTEVDGEVERYIVDRLTRIFPKDGIIGEEGAGREGEGYWVIDPVDGTANFARGLPHFCVSIGYFRNGRPEVGAIAAPLYGELYAGAIGLGATLNGQPIKAATTASLKEANMELGWNTRRPNEDYLRLLNGLMAAGANVRRSGSGALGVVYVAAGRSDAYVETHINAWDVAAGLVIAREAGARISNFFDGEGLRKGNRILVAAPTLAEDLAKVTGFDLLP